MSAEAWGFVSLTFTTVAGFWSQWAQTRRNHLDNVNLVRECVIGLNEFREHMVRKHGAVPVAPIAVPERK